MAQLFDLFAASDRNPITIPRVRGAAVRHLHDDHAGHPNDRHLARRDGHRAAEEGGDALEQKVPMEKHPGRLRTLLHRMVFALYESGCEI